MLLAFAASCWLTFKLVSSRILGSLLQKLLSRRSVPNLCVGLFPLQVPDCVVPLDRIPLSFYSLRGICVCPLLQPAQVPLNGSTGVWCSEQLALFFAVVVDMFLQVGNCGSYQVLNEQQQQQAQACGRGKWSNNDMSSVLLKDVGNEASPCCASLVVPSEIPLIMVRLD